MRKNKITGNLRFLGYLGFLGLLMTSCQREPLYDEIGNLQLDIAIDYNIKHMPDVPEPEVMFVGFYDQETGKLQRTEYTGPHGGEIYTNPGTYDILVYNFDTEATQIRNNGDINKAEAYTNAVPTRISQEYRAMIQKIKEKKQSTSNSRGSQYEGQPIINEPDHLFAGADFDVEVPVRSDVEQTFTIHADASTLLDTYALSIGPIKGMEYVKDAEIFITGQAQSKNIAKRQISGDPATLYIPIDLTKKARETDDRLRTTFNTFGKYPGADNKIYLIVKLLDIDENITLVETDITDQFDNPDNTEDEIDIEQDIEIQRPADGLVPTVNEWGTNVTNIYIK